MKRRGFLIGLGALAAGGWLLRPGNQGAPHTPYFQAINDWLEGARRLGAGDVSGPTPQRPVGLLRGEASDLSNLSIAHPAEVGALRPRAAILNTATVHLLDCARTQVGAARQAFALPPSIVAQVNGHTAALRSVRSRNGKRLRVLIGFVKE